MGICKVNLKLKRGLTVCYIVENILFIYFIYSQYHDNIYIQVYTCANGLDVGIAYICPLQLVRQFKYIYTHIVMQLQKLQVVQIHLYIYKVLVIGMKIFYTFQFETFLCLQLILLHFFCL